MHLNRRAFLILSASFTAGCAAPGGATFASDSKEKVINAGPASQYLADDVYIRYRDAGIFIIRKGAELFAVSSICTHRNCKLNSQPDKSFYCPCHGSTFDPNGKVTKSPARKDLPRFPVSTNDAGELIVKLAT
jgi:Rieske Fe-S protein